MLIEQLSIAYKCHSSIGNSVDLKEMMHEVLKTFVSESYGICAKFFVQDENKNLVEFTKFGKPTKISIKHCDNTKEGVILYHEDDFDILKINLEVGAIFLILKNYEFQFDFFISMFESLIPKLNLSVNACLNYERLNSSYKILQQQKIELLKANRTKDDFLANMSHELKTPLNSIMVISSVMAKNKDQKLDSQQVKNMEIIKKCSDDLLELINDILDISKIEAGEIVIHKEHIDLEIILNELFESFEPMAKEKNLDFVKNYEVGDFKIYSDEMKIKQIIKNLLSNAIKFTSSGKIEIEVGFENNFIEVRVRDTGIGMKPEQLNNIFDRFKQIDDSRTRKYKGTGLGLAISKEFSILLDGNLSCQSNLNEGSIFTLILPRNESSKFFEVSKNDGNESKEIESQNVAKKHILLLHSNSLEQFNLTMLLRRSGFDVTPVVNLERLKDKILMLERDNLILLIDERIEEINKRILDVDYNIKIVTLNKGKSIIKNSLFSLDYDLKHEILVEKIKNFFD